MPATGQLRRFDRALLLFLLSLALYFPFRTWFQSDDFAALVYAADPARVAADFTGPQYGLTRTALFWRPLITLSFFVEGALFGDEPFWVHLDNALVHSMNTVLVLALLSRLLGKTWGFRGALLWALNPAHIGSVTWAVGRVDVHATFWILLTLLLHLRRQPGRWSLLPPLVTFALALATKEIALALPGLVGIVTLGTETEGGWRERLRRALGATLPYLALLGPWFLLRWGCLGQVLGGYAGATDPGEALLAFPLWPLRLAAPLASPLGERVCGSWAGWLGVGGLVAAAVLAAAAVRRGGEKGPGQGVLLGGLFFLVACVPLAPTFVQTDNLTNLRLYYLPLVGLSAVLAAGGWRSFLLVALLLLPAHLPARGDVRQAYTFNRNAHRAVRAAGEGRELLFVQGLEPARGVALRFNIGPDRLLEPPFGPGKTLIRPWRPLEPSPRYRDWEPAKIGFAAAPVLPIVGEGMSAGMPPVPATPRLRLTHNLPAAFGAGELLPLATADPYHLQVGPGRYRVMVFTGHGFAGCLAEADREGRLSFRDHILNRREMLFPLRVALDVDLRPIFHLLVQRLDERGRTRAEAKLIELRFKPSAMDVLWPQ